MDPEHDQLDTLARRIRYVRGRISQEEFGQTLGVHRNSIARYEKGLGRPDTNFIDALHNHYNINPLWLVSCKGPISKPVLDKVVCRGIADRLNKIIGSRDITKFAQRVGIDPLDVDDLMQGRIIPRLELIVEISKGCGVSADWLITGNDSQKTSKIDTILLEDIIEKVEKILNRRDQKLTPGRKAQLVTTYYDLYADTGKEIEISIIERLLILDD